MRPSPRPRPTRNPRRGRAAGPWSFPADLERVLGDLEPDRLLGRCDAGLDPFSEDGLPEPDADALDRLQLGAAALFLGVQVVQRVGDVAAEDAKLRGGPSSPTKDWSTRADRSERSCWRPSSPSSAASFAADTRAIRSRVRRSSSPTACRTSMSEGSSGQFTIARALSVPPNPSVADPLATTTRPGRRKSRR